MTHAKQRRTKLVSLKCITNDSGDWGKDVSDVQALAQHCFTLESKLFAYERELHEAHARIAELEVGCVRAWLWCFFPRRRAQSAHSAVRQRRTLLCGVAARRCPLWALPGRKTMYRGEASARFFARAPR